MPNYEVTLEVDPGSGRGDGRLHAHGAYPRDPAHRVLFAHHVRTLGLGPFPHTLRGGEPRGFGRLFPRPRRAPAPGLPEAFPTGRRAITRCLDGGRTLEWGPGKCSLNRRWSTTHKADLAFTQGKTAGHRPGCRGSSTRPCMSTVSAPSGTTAHITRFAPLHATCCWSEERLPPARAIVETVAYSNSRAATFRSSTNCPIFRRRSASVCWRRIEEG